MKQLALIIATVLLAATACAPAGQTDRVLPDEQLERLDGGTYELRQTGQARALNLWATWCAPCRAELPAFDDVASRVDDVDIVGINVGDTGTDAADLVQELNLQFDQVLDPLAAVQSSLRITGMPATIFLDATGQIVDVHSGELDVDELEALLVEHFNATFSP